MYLNKSITNVSRYQKPWHFWDFQQKRSLVFFPVLALQTCLKLSWPLLCLCYSSVFFLSYLFPYKISQTSHQMQIWLPATQCSIWHLTHVLLHFHKNLFHFVFYFALNLLLSELIQHVFLRFPYFIPVALLLPKSFLLTAIYMHMDDHDYQNQNSGELCDICCVNWHFSFRLQELWGKVRQFVQLFRKHWLKEAESFNTVY